MVVFSLFFWCGLLWCMIKNIVISHTLQTLQALEISVFKNVIFCGPLHLVLHNTEFRQSSVLFCLNSREFCKFYDLFIIFLNEFVKLLIWLKLCVIYSALYSANSVFRPPKVEQNYAISANSVLSE